MGQGMGEHTCCSFLNGKQHEYLAYLFHTPPG